MKVTPKGKKTAQKVIDYDYEWEEEFKHNFTEEEYNSISFHCTSLGNYTNYLENYITRITTSISLERN